MQIRDKHSASGKQAKAARRLARVTVRGTNREMGRQYGEACRESIKSLVEVGLEVINRGHQLPREQALAWGRRYLPHLEKFCPHLLEELHGLAEGAGISFEEALFIQIRTELTYPAATPEGCTAFALAPERSATGEVIAGQNWDTPAEFEDLLMLLHLVPDEGPEALMYCVPGVIGYMGFSSAGIAHFANQLVAGTWGEGVPHYFLKRRMLEAATFDECVELARKYRFSSSANIVLAAATGRVANIEVVPGAAAVLTDAQGAVTHTNHCLHPPFQGQDRLAPSFEVDTFKRLERIRELTQGEGDGAGGVFGVDDMKEILSDHRNGPKSICRHRNGNPKASKTTLSLIIEPARGCMHVALGNPCENEYITYSL